MRSETKRALKLAVEKSERLRDGGYVRTLRERGGTHLSYSWKREEDESGGTVSIDQSRPDEDSTDALILTFRFFIQKNEAPSFRWLATNVLDDPGLSDEWKQEFTDIRDQLNKFLDQSSGYNERVVAPPPDGVPGEARLDGEYEWTNRQIMDVFIYGGMAHADPEKSATYQRWRSNQLGFPYVQHLFDSIIMAGLRAVALLGHISERELAAHDQKSNLEPAGG